MGIKTSNLWAGTKINNFVLLGLQGTGMGAVGFWFQSQLGNQISESCLVSGEVPGHFRITLNNIGFKHFDLLMVYLAVHVTGSM